MKTSRVAPSTAAYTTRSHDQLASQYSTPGVPDTSCSCFDPDSRSRTSGATKEAATNANGISMMIDAKMPRNADRIAVSRLVRGSGWAAALSE